MQQLDSEDGSRTSRVTDAERLAAIVESSEDAIFSEDLSGVITSWNRGAECVFGFNAQEMIGTSIMRLASEERQAEGERILVRIRRGERVEHFETVRLRKDGRSVDVSVSASPIKDDKGRVVGVSKIVRDISAWKERERELARLSRLYSALSHVNQAIVWTASREELFDRICRGLVEHGGFRMSWIGWHDPQTQCIHPMASAGDEEGYLKTISVYGDERPEGKGPSGIPFRTGRPYVSNDLLADPVARPWHPALMRHRLRASAAFPICEGGQVRGTLSVYAEEAGFFADREIALLNEAAADISFALDNLAREDKRRRAEQTVRQERDFSAAVLNSLPGVLYLYDQSGKFLRWNRNFERVTGYSAAEVGAMHPLDFFEDRDKAFVESRIGEVFAKGYSHVEAGFRAKDGRITPYYFTGVMTVLDGKACLVGVGIDITERKRVEQERIQSEARYRTLFEYAPDGIVIADRDSTYLDANASICQMLGYERQELIGLHASDIVVPTEVEQVALALDEIKARADHKREWQFRRKDGSGFAAEVLATLMPDGNVLGMIRDISDRKEAERALREMNETLEAKVTARTEELQSALVRAEAADRLKSAFLATMSHELRTPLNSIIGFTGILQQGLAGPLTMEQSKQLGMVRGSARHLLELINDVLDISKIEADQLELHREQFEVGAALERVLSVVKPMADKKGLTLAAEISQAPTVMISDRRRFEQVLLNLLSNAVKFTDLGGVNLTAEIIDGVVSSDASLTGKAIRLRVVDTGIGIRPEDLSSLFQPFRQIDTGLARQREGTGLGLAICRRLATLLGGEISATSEPSKGSVFTVTLPLHGVP